VWHPEKQRGVEIKHRPGCNQDSLKFKSSSEPRAIHSVEEMRYATIAIYRCSNQSCNKNTFNLFLDADILGISATIMLGTPFILMNKTGWTVEMLVLALHVVSSESGANWFCKFVAQQRMRTFLIAANSYQEHLDYFANKDRASLLFGSTEETTESPQYPPFSEFFDHCSYDGSTGPTAPVVIDVFVASARFQVLVKGYMGGITGFKVAADHHHNVSARVKVDDTLSNRFRDLVNGIHAWCNEQRN